MRKKLRWIPAAMLLFAGGPAHAAAPPASGTISVEPTAVEPALRSSMPAFVDAVDRALADRDFTPLAQAGHARFVADLTLTRVAVGTTTAKVPVAGVSAQGGTSSPSVGGTVNLALPTAKTRTMSLQQTRLEIRIRKRGEQAVIWQGTAMTVRARGASDGKDAAVASDLSEALFRGYPAQPEAVISVP